MKKQGFQVTVEGSDREITCLDNEALLLAMERQGYATVPIGCRQGGCGICKIRVTEGEFETGKMSVRHVTQEDRKDNFSLACKTFPKSDLKFAVVKRKNQVINTKELFDQN